MKYAIAFFLAISLIVTSLTYAQKNRGEVGVKGNKFIWTNTGEAFVPNYLMMEMFANDLSEVTEENLNAFIKEFFVGHGFNGVHVPVMGEWFHIGNKKVDAEDEVPDPKTLAKLKMIITKVYEAGGCTHLWMWGDAQRNQTAASTKGGIMGAQEKTLLDDIAKELGPLPGWSLGYGFDLWEWVNEAQLNEWHNYLWNKPNWNHLLGARASKNELDQISENLDYASYEYHKPWHPQLREMIEKRPDKPSFSEDRYRIRYPSKYPDKDYDAEETRLGLWHHTMAGGIAAIWGNLIGNGIYENKESIRTFFTFWNKKKRFHADMEAKVHGNTFSLEAKEKYYAFYQENTKSIECEIEGKSMKVLAVDVLKPYKEIKMGKTSGGNYIFNAPYQSDWVLYIAK